VIELAFPLVLGALVAWRGLFPDPEAALDVLNRYALYVAFPLLVILGLTGESFSAPTNVGFWVATPLSFALTLALVWLTSRTRPVAGTVALTAVFGNTAYLGLPVLVQILGDEIVGLASLGVSFFVFFSLVSGPALLIRWSDGEGAAQGSVVRKLVRQPLLWAPLLGGASRLLPAEGLAGLRPVLGPVGHSAAPVALFMLGMYLYLHRQAVRQITPTLMAHVGFKMGVLPVVMGAVGHLLGLPHDQWVVLTVLAAMPVAITTFSIAREFDVGQERVAQAIVASTLLSVATIPWMVWALG